MTEYDELMIALDAVLQNNARLSGPERECIGRLMGDDPAVAALLVEVQRERDYSAAILERTGALYRAANEAVAAWQGHWPADVDGTMEALLSAVNATEIGEDEAAEEVEALRRERDEAKLTEARTDDAWRVRCAELERNYRQERQKLRAALEAERKRADEWQAAATGAAVVEEQVEFDAMRQERNALHDLASVALRRLAEAVDGDRPTRKHVRRLVEIARGLGVDVDALNAWEGE